MSDSKKLKIVSGGQTGVDRAALDAVLESDAALESGTSAGGWCPEGRLAEDGPIAEKYPLQELPDGGYEERTLQNVQDSDATVIIYFEIISGGTEEDVDAFLDQQQERYTEQLEKYGALMKLQVEEPIKLGLYFPLLQGWREWECSR